MGAYAGKQTSRALEGPPSPPRALHTLTRAFRCMRLHSQNVFEPRLQCMASCHFVELTHLPTRLHHHEHHMGAFLWCRTCRRQSTVARVCSYVFLHVRFPVNTPSFAHLVPDTRRVRSSTSLSPRNHIVGVRMSREKCLTITVTMLVILNIGCFGASG